MSEEKKEQTYSGKTEESSNTKVQTVKVKTVNVMFKENRKFDLHIGRNMITFFGRESKSIPAVWLQHKDWANVQKYFVVKGA